MSKKWTLIATNALQVYEPEAAISNFKEKIKAKQRKREKNFKEELKIREMKYTKPKKNYKKDNTEEKDD